MATNISSLGDASQVPIRLIKETRPLPTNRAEILLSISQILDGGGVQRITIQLNHPIEVERLVRSTEPVVNDVPVELTEAEDPMNAVRNAPMIELSFVKNISAFEYLFRAFHVLAQKRLKAKTFFIRDRATLLEWLGLSGEVFDFGEVYGVEVKTIRDLPKDTAILAAVSPNETDLNAITQSIKLSLNVKVEELDDGRDEAVHEEDSGVGLGGQAHGQAHGELEVPAAGSLGIGKA